MSHKHKSKRPNPELNSNRHPGEDEGIFTLFVVLLGLSTLATVTGVMVASLI